MKLSKAVDEFMRGYFAARGRVQQTAGAYGADLAQFRDYVGGDVGISSLSSAVVGRWMDHLRAQEYSPASIKRKMAALRVFCSYWVRKGVMSESPFWRLELEYEQVEQAPRVMSEREMRKLLAQARRNHMAAEVEGDSGFTQAGARRKHASPSFRATRDLALVEVLCATGMRVGELSALDVGDLRLKDSVFKVSGPRGRDRLAYVLGETAMPALQDYLSIREAAAGETPALFINSSGARMTTQGITNVVARLCAQAGIGRVTPSVFRNTVEKMLLGKRVDLRVVMQYLGKTSVADHGVPHLTGDHVIGELRKVHPSLGF